MNFTSIEAGGLEARQCPVGSEYSFNAIRSVPNRARYNMIVKLMTRAYGKGVTYATWKFDNYAIDNYTYDQNTWYCRYGDYSLEIFLTSSEQMQYLILLIPTISLKVTK